MAQRSKGIIRKGRERDPVDVREDRKRRKESRVVRKTLFEQINAIARRDARLEIGDKKNHLFLTNWWCRQYNRPLKDPLLNQYTIEELAYEFFLINEIAIYKDELINEETDRIEEAIEQEGMDWADQMEAEEEAEEKALAKKLADKAEAAKKAKEEAGDPLRDPDQVKWMEEEIKKSKSVFGDDFGEDVSLDFESDD